MTVPLFLFGYPRSGTTLLRSMIGLHSQVSLTNEIDIIPNAILSGYKPDAVFNQEERKKFINNIRPRKRKSFENLDETVKRYFLNHPDNMGLDELVRCVCIEKNENKVFGDKSVIGIFYTEVFNMIFPNALFICIIRDPRSAIMSKLVKDKLSGKFTNHIEINSESFVCNKLFVRTCVLAERWRIMEHLANNAERKYGGNRWLTIRYEDLVSRPETVLKCICKFADLDFEKKMLNTDERQSDIVLQSEASQRHHRLLVDEVSTDRISTYENLPSELNYIITKITRQGMSHHQYDFGATRRYFKIRTYIRSILLRNKILNELRNYFKRYVSQEYMTQFYKLLRE